MFQFFETLFNMISSVVGFVVKSLANVTQLFINAAQGVAFVSFVFAYMPGFLQIIIASLLGLAVVKFILNFGRS